MTCLLNRATETLQNCVTTFHRRWTCSTALAACSPWPKLFDAWVITIWSRLATASKSTKCLEGLSNDFTSGQRFVWMLYDQFQHFQELVRAESQHDDIGHFKRLLIIQTSTHSKKIFQFCKEYLDNYAKRLQPSDYDEINEFVSLSKIPISSFCWHLVLVVFLEKSVTVSIDCNWDDSHCFDFSNGDGRFWSGWQILQTVGRYIY